MKPSTDPHQILEMLKVGNRRYVAGRVAGPHRCANRRRLIAAAQEPFALIVGCSDSRVPPELIFDRGLGDLFVVRTAGHVADFSALGSVEYGVAHLHIPLIVVLGHDRCGAIVAAAAQNASGHHGPTGQLLRNLRPAILKARRVGGDLVSCAVDFNIALTVEQIRQLTPVRRASRTGRLLVVGARYSLETGRVKVLAV